MGILSRLLAGSAGPWILIGVLLAGSLAAGAAYRHGKHTQLLTDQVAEAAAVQRALAHREAQYQADLAARAEAEQEHLDRVNAENLSLARALTEIEALPPKTLIQTKVVDHGCPVPSLSADFWTRYRALGVRDASTEDHER